MMLHNNDVFARVLIDVDLAEKMFESVVIEREDNALSISMQYEKHPMFCSHCKMLGHIIQNCSKLNTSSKIDGPDMRKPQHATNKSIHKHVLKDNGKNSVPGSSNLPGMDLNDTNGSTCNGQKSTDQRQNKHVVKAPATCYRAAIILENIPVNPVLIEETFDSADDFAEGDCLDMNEPATQT